MTYSSQADSPPSRAYAHTTEGPEDQWEPLIDHLRAVAHRAASLAGAFGARNWGRLAGLWHDVGKYRPEFQAYIRGRRAGVEHSGAGAVLASKLGSSYGGLLAFTIAGHHAGLANLASSESSEFEGLSGFPIPLKQRLIENKNVLESVQPTIPRELLEQSAPTPPANLAELEQGGPLERALAFWVRFVFSALVDADRLETARFYAKHKPKPLHSDLRYGDIPALRDRLDAHIDALARRSSRTAVNALRLKALAACRSAAPRPPGRFSLTVPTGGGKTLSAMSFALRHAAEHGLRRVIVVIPYTSIIEQNAKIYQEILGTENVLEHHSNLDELKLSEIDAEAETRRKLAAENWDTPVVVTTSVQFLESLFSNHPSRCRKLHNISRSVVILDEVQTLPPTLLSPILHALDELTERYGCSLVLSTATPPALAQRGDEQEFGLTNVLEIIPGPDSLARQARRVRVRWSIKEPTPYNVLARQLAEHDQALAIVHRRQDAHDLAEAVEQVAGAGGLFHLSALMCPAHRLDVLAQVEAALKAGQVCRLVSTQLVEAGVDVDFPVVYRALAGLDSLAQAAGRCDREGKLTAARHGEPGGELVVFRAPTHPPPGALRKAMQSTETLLKKHDNLDLFDPETCEIFFRELYRKDDPDKHSILRDAAGFNFAFVAAKFKMIDNAVRPVVVPYGEGLSRIDRFHSELTREHPRTLQPFTVQISPSHHEALATAGALVTLHERVDILAHPFHSRYTDRFGLDPRIDGVMDAEVAVV